MFDIIVMVSSMSTRCLLSGNLTVVFSLKKSRLMDRCREQGLSLPISG